MSDRNGKPVTSSKLIFHDVTDKQYRISRKAPPPPNFRSFTNDVYKVNDDGNLVVAQIRHTNIEKSKSNRKFSVENSTPDCLECIIKKLRNKEAQYITKLKILLQKLEVVSTSVCNKLSLMKNILNIHNKLILKKMNKISDARDVPNIFLECGRRLLSYEQFAQNRDDFSYLVKDICESIIDHFKARLLEYNFTLSQIKNIYALNLEVKNCCDEAEATVRNLYQKIVVATRNQVGC